MKYPSKLAKILTKKFLIKEYTKNKKSLNQIANKINCSGSTVRRSLINHNIPIRTKNEARWLFNIKGKKSGRYIDGRSLEPNYCIDCGKKICYVAKRCKSCSYKKKWENKEYRKKIIKFGKNNHNWNGGSSFEPYPISWTTQLKESIRIRDEHICQICGKTTKQNGRKLDIHHIDYTKENLDIENLISLCIFCLLYFIILLNILKNSI